MDDHDLYFADLTWPRIQQALAAEPPTVILFPVGSTEPHGPHSPLSTDVVISEGICIRAARQLADDPEMRALILPSLDYAITRFAAAFPGAITVGEEGFRALVVDICGSLVKQGFRHVAIVNNHFEPKHVQALHRCIDEVESEHGALVGYVDLTRKERAVRLTEEFRRRGGFLRAAHGDADRGSPRTGRRGRRTRSARPLRTGLMERTSAGLAIDPVTFEIIRHKLVQVTDETIIALENVSGSPITNEGHDLMASLYSRDGGLMIGGVGFLHHLTSAAQAVKHIISTFSDDPGIDEDDAYFFNDSYTAALHPPDVYMISPIHFKSELRGFVANFVHVTDIGAIDPGGFSPNARDNYQEGFQTKGLKVVERGKMRRDVVDTFLNMVRDPGMTALDLKSQLAANHVAKQRMKAHYEEYGADVVEAVANELIRQSEQLVRERLSALPDGSWCAREYIDMPGGSCKVELTATKQGDELTYDFTGSSPQVDLGINCCYWATWGGMFAPIFPLLAWDVTWNEGVTRPIRLIAPEGTVVNCIRPAPISIATVATIQIVNNLSTLVLSKLFGASEGSGHRATAVWHGSHAHVETHGVDSEGDFFVAPLTDTFGGAAGARSFRDGVDMGGEIPNVVSRWANAESQELNTPLLYLYRRAVPDSGGPGKFRGGVCHEYAFTPNGTQGPMGLILFGKGTRAPMSLGISGGYPGCNVGYSTFRRGNVDVLPRSFEETRGESREDRFWGAVELEEGDIQYVRFMGGGG